MNAPGSLPLVEALRIGSDSAARQVHDRYVSVLLQVAKKRIGQRMSSRLDPEDIVQSVFRTFFSRVKNDQFVINQEDELLRLLIQITTYKALRQIAHHRAAKRNPGQESVQGDGDAHDAIIQQISDAAPSPEVVVEFLDQLTHFMDRLDAGDRQVLELRLQGSSTEEIAKELGLYDRKVRRILERIRGVAEKEYLEVK